MFKKSKNLGKGRTNNPNQCLNKCKVTTRILSVDFLDNCVHGHIILQNKNGCVGYNFRKKKCQLLRRVGRMVKKRGSTAGKCV